MVLYNLDGELVSNQTFDQSSSSSSKPHMLTDLPSGEELNIHVTVINQLGNSKTLIFEVKNETIMIGKRNEKTTLEIVL